MEHSDIIERIKYIRKESGLSMDKFAKALGISSSGNISAWESGKALPGALALKAIHDVFGYSIDWILTGEHASSTQPLEDSNPLRAELITLFDSVSPDAQQLLLGTVRTILQNALPATNNNPSNAPLTSLNTDVAVKTDAKDEIA